jgi:hypothetical protein
MKNRNRYTVDFNQEINKMFRRKSVLMPFFSNNEFRCLCHRYCTLLPNARWSNLRNLLNSSDCFDNELFQILFNAFVFAESKFVHNFIPQKSHEERLTGHLISEYISALEIVKKVFQEKSLELYDENLTLDFHYTDLSANNREKTTGADFGILFHINLPDYPEEVRAIILQAKKLGHASTININQCNTLKKFAGDGAYYCFYDMETPETSSPLVLSADNIKLPTNAKQETIQYPRDRLFKPYEDEGGIPLSIFLIFTLLAETRNNSHFKTFDNVKKAAKFFENGERSNNKDSEDKTSYELSRILSISIGGLSVKQELTNLSDLFEIHNDEG